MEHGDKGGGVQPVRDDSPVARPFLPVSRRERLLCVLLASIAIVACAYAVRAIPALADALTDDEVASAEAVDDASGFSGSGGGKIEGQPEKVRGDDGKEYVVFQGPTVRAAKARYAQAKGQGDTYSGCSASSVACRDSQADYILNTRYSPGVYKLEPGVSSNLHLAGLGTEAAQRFASTAIGRKLIQASMVPLVSFAVQTGAMTVMDETLAKEAPAIETAMVEVMSEVTPMAAEIAMTSTEGITVLPSEMSVAAVDVLCSNAARGVTMTTEELAAETASRWMSTSSGGAGFEYMTDAFLTKLSNGLVACEDLPLLSQAGQMLLEMGGYELSAFPDADGFTGSGGGEISGANTPEYDSSLTAGQVILVPEKNVSNKVFNYVSYCRYYVAYNPNITTRNILAFYFDCYKADGQYIGGSYIALDDPAYPNSSAGSITVTFGDGVTVYEYQDKESFDADRAASTQESASKSYNEFGSVGASGTTSFFDEGGQLIGNDAQFGDNGELIDYGNADITPTLYDDNYNPTTWNQVLIDAGLNAVDPSAEQPAADDEIQAGENQGQPAGDATGKPTPGEPGSTPTVPRVQMQLDTTMADLSGDIGTKFPFSIPFNVSTAMNMLVASPEAPHFTWVFAVPTGNVEYEVDLSPFSPVAHVLRVMLDVLMVFCVISLLGKIAQVWGFFDKSAD